MTQNMNDENAPNNNLTNDMPVKGPRLTGERIHRGPLLDSQGQKVKPLTDELDDEEDRKRRLMEG